MSRKAAKLRRVRLDSCPPFSKVRWHGRLYRVEFVADNCVFLSPVRRRAPGDEFMVKVRRDVCVKLVV